MQGIVCERERGRESVSVRVCEGRQTAAQDERRVGSRDSGREESVAPIAGCFLSRLARASAPLSLSLSLPLSLSLSPSARKSFTCMNCERKRNRFTLPACVLACCPSPALPVVPLCVSSAI